MVDLLPGAVADNVLELFDEVARRGENLSSTTSIGVDLLNAYREWANQSARTLSKALPASELDELLLTRGYERLLQLDPRAYGNVISTPVALELEAAVGRLRSAKGALQAQRDSWQEWRRFRRQPLSVVVLDTNVLLRHVEHLDEIDWRSPLEVWSHDPIALAIPLVVVEELDRLKSATHRMRVDGEDVPVKARTRVVLRKLDEWFEGAETRHVLHEQTPDNPRRGSLLVQLLLDDLHHERLPRADAEIIDRSLALEPFTYAVGLATNDRAMRFSARHAGLVAFDPRRGPDA